MTTSPPEEPTPGSTPDEPESSLHPDFEANQADRGPDPLLDDSRDVTPPAAPPTTPLAEATSPQPPASAQPPLAPPLAPPPSAAPPSAAPPLAAPPPPPAPTPSPAGPAAGTSGAGGAGGLPPAWGASQPGTVPPPPPGYGAPPPGYRAPPPGYGAPPPGYGAPPSGYVPAAAPLSAGDAISYAVGAFRRNAGQLILIALVIAAIQGALDLAQQSIDYGIGSALIGLIGLVVTWILSLGLVQAALAVLDGRRPDISMLFSSPKLGAYLLGALLATIAVAVGFVLCIIPGFIALFLFQLWGFALVDGPRSDAVEAIKTSIAVVRANAGPIFVLDLLIFLAWFAIFVVLSILVFLVPILGFLAIVVAGLLVYPVSALALAYAWRRLTGGVVAPVA